MPSPSEPGPPPAGPGLRFAEDVLEVVASIPPGRVMTYGDIAAVLGSRGARRVGQVMARYGSDVPWWRVVRAGGHPPRCHEDGAREHYLEEGTPLRHVPAGTPRASRPSGGYRLDMDRARWSPFG